MIKKARIPETTANSFYQSSVKETRDGTPKNGERGRKIYEEKYTSDVMAGNMANIYKQNQ